MRVLNHKEYCCFEYNDLDDGNCPFELGDIVIKVTTNEIGVVIQKQNRGFRTDMFGNDYASYKDQVICRLATAKEIETYRNKLYIEFFHQVETQLEKEFNKVDTARGQKMFIKSFDKFVVASQGERYDMVEYIQKKLELDKQGEMIGFPLDKVTVKVAQLFLKTVVGK